MLRANVGLVVDIAFELLFTCIQFVTIRQLIPHTHDLGNRIVIRAVSGTRCRDRRLSLVFISHTAHTAVCILTVIPPKATLLQVCIFPVQPSKSFASQALVTYVRFY